MKLMSMREREEVININRAVSDASFDAAKVFWRVKVIDDRKQILDDSMDVELAVGVHKEDREKWKQLVNIQSSAVQERRFASFKKTDGDEFVTRRDFQLAKYSESDGASYWYAARPGDTKQVPIDWVGVQKQ